MLACDYVSSPCVCLRGPTCSRREETEYSLSPLSREEFVPGSLMCWRTIPVHTDCIRRENLHRSESSCHGWLRSLLDRLCRGCPPGCNKDICWSRKGRKIYQKTSLVNILATDSVFPPPPPWLRIPGKYTRIVFFPQFPTRAGSQ